jgi:hypothetical protein
VVELEYVDPAVHDVQFNPEGDTLLYPHSLQVGQLVFGSLVEGP